MFRLTGKLSSDECEGLYSVDLIENCSDLPPSSAASCFTGRNLRQINQTALSSTPRFARQQHKFGLKLQSINLISLNGRGLGHKWELQSSAFFSIKRNEIILSQKDYVSIQLKVSLTAFTSTFHAVINDQWSTICLSMEQNGRCLGFPNKMDYCEEIMHRNENASVKWNEL